MLLVDPLWSSNSFLRIPRNHLLILGRLHTTSRLLKSASNKYKASKSFTHILLIGIILLNVYLWCLTCYLYTRCPTGLATSVSVSRRTLLKVRKRPICTLPRWRSLNSRPHNNTLPSPAPCITRVGGHHRRPLSRFLWPVTPTHWQGQLHPSKNTVPTGQVTMWHAGVCVMAVQLCMFLSFHFTWCFFKYGNIYKKLQRKRIIH